MQPLLCGNIFEDLYQQPNRSIIEELDKLLFNYQKEHFWKSVKQMLIHLKLLNKHQLIYNILTRLMNEQRINTVIRKSYVFLFFGKEMNMQRRLNFVGKTQQEQFKFYLYNLIFLQDMDHLLQYKILQNLFMDQSQLTLQKLCGMINEPSLKTRVKQIMKSSRKQPQISFNLNQKLSEKDLIEIYEIILPLNLTAIKLLQEQFLKVQDFQKYKNQQIYVLIGPTGVGKSTLILYLLGYQFEECLDDPKGYKYKRAVDLRDQHKMIESRYDTNSITSRINIVSDNERRVLLTDTPGDADSRGLTRIFFNSMLRNILFQQCKRVKIIKVVYVKALLEKKQLGLRQFAKQIIKNFNFKNQFDLEKQLTIILNKCDPQYSEVKYLIYLLKQQIKKPYLYQQQQQLTVYKFLLGQMSKKQPDQLQFVIPDNFFNNAQIREQLLNFIKRQKNTVNPQDFIKYTIDPQIGEAMKSTKQYFVNNITISFQKEEYETTLYYYQRMVELLVLCPKLSLQQSIEQKIKNKFYQQYRKFQNIVSQGSEKDYNQYEFRQLKHHMHQLTIAQKFRPYIKAIKTISSLQERKREIIESYKRKLSQGLHSDTLIKNYQQFLKLFGINQDPIEPLIFANQSIRNKINQIISSTFKFDDLDNYYNQLIQNINTIKILDPNSQSCLLQQLNLYMQQNIVKLYGYMENSFIQEVKYLQQIGQFYQFLLVRPIQRKLTILQHIQKYRKYNQSQVMRIIKTTLQKKALIKRQQILINKLKVQLSKKLKEFSNIILLKQTQIDKIIVISYRQFIKPYYAIDQIKQQIGYEQQSLNQEILKKKQIISGEIIQFLKMFKRLLQESEMVPNFKNQTDFIRKIRQKQDFYSFYLRQRFNQQQLFDVIKRLLDQQKNHIKEYSSLQNPNKMKDFRQIIEKIGKLRLIQQAVPEVKNEVIEIDEKIGKIFECLVQSIKIYFANNRRLEKFIQAIKRQQYIKNLQFSAYVYQNLKKIHYNQSFLSTIKKIFEEILKNCQKISKMQINYHQQGRLKHFDDQETIFFQKLFDVFDFLNRIVSILEFKCYFGNQDVRLTIIDNLTKQLLTIQQYVNKKAKQKELQLNDYFISDRMNKLYYISKQSFSLYDSSKNVIDHSSVKNLKNKYQSIRQFVHLKCNDSDQPVSLNIKGFQSLKTILNKFLQIYNKQKHRKYIKDKLQTQLFRIIEEKLQISENKFIKNPESLIKEHYLKLKIFQSQLRENSDIDIKELNEFISKLDIKIQEIIKNYYESSIVQFKNKKIMEAKRFLQKILQITKLDQNNFQDKFLIPNIRELIDKIKNQQQNITNIDKTIISKNNMDFYQCFNEIKLFILNDLTEPTRTKIKLRIQIQIDKLVEDCSQRDDPFTFREKYKKIKQIISLIYSYQKKERKHTIDRLQQALSQRKQKIQTKMTREITLFQDNYGMMMQMEHLCLQFQLEKAIYQIRKNKGLLLNNIKNSLSHVQTDVKDMFQLVNQLFWVQNITSQILQKFLPENKAWQENYINLITSLKVYHQIEVLSNRSIVVMQQSQMIDNQFLTKFLRQFGKYKHKLYNPKLYESIKNNIKQRLQIARDLFKDRYQTLDSIISQMDPKPLIHTAQKDNNLILLTQINASNQNRTKKKKRDKLIKV